MSWFRGERGDEPRQATLEHIRRRRDGSQLHARISVLPVRDGEARPSTRLGFVEVVTVRRSLVGQLRHAGKMGTVERLAGGSPDDPKSSSTPPGRGPPRREEGEPFTGEVAIESNGRSRPPRRVNSKLA